MKDWRDDLGEAVRGVVKEWDRGCRDIHFVIDGVVDGDISVNLVCFERDVLPPHAYQRLADLLSEITGWPVEVTLLRPTVRFRDRSAKSLAYWAEHSHCGYEHGELWGGDTGNG